MKNNINDAHLAMKTISTPKQKVFYDAKPEEILQNCKKLKELMMTNMFQLDNDRQIIMGYLEEVFGPQVNTLRRPLTF